MRSHLFSFSVTLVGALVLFCSSSLSFAQEKEVTATGGANSKPTTRAADGHPDLTGSWGGTGGGAHQQAVTKDGKSIKVSFGGGSAVPVADDPEQKQAFLHYDDPVAVRKADPNQPPYKPELLDKVKHLDLNENKLDPAFSCKWPGVPRMGPPNQIMQAPGLLVFLYTNEQVNTFREIPTDGRPHDPFVEDTYNGDSIGHWEGDTLVVDVVGFNAETWLGIDGWFHSDKMHVIERLTRDGDTLHYQATVEDPEVFTRPWIMNPRTVKLTKELIVENGPCIDHDQEHMADQTHH